MLPKLRFVTFSRVLRVSCILCGVLVLMVFTTSCQKGKDETVSKEKAEELSQTSKYMLDDEEVMEAIRSGITMDEINFLIYIARRADKPVSDLLALKRNGLSISEIDKQLSENDEGLNHQ